MSWPEGYGPSLAAGAQVRHCKLHRPARKAGDRAREDVRRTWKLPYVAIDSLTTETDVRAYEPPPEPAAQTVKTTFRVGDAKGTALVGIFTRVNRRTATLQAMDGRNWRVGLELLSHVLDV